MGFVFSRRFYVLLALGIVPLALSWKQPELRTAVFILDFLLIAAAVADYWLSRTLPEEFTIRREFGSRFAIGDPVRVSLIVENASPRDVYIRVKDEFPPEMKLDETREAAFNVAAQTNAEFYYHVTPPKRGRYEFGKTAVRICLKARARLVSG